MHDDDLPADWQDTIEIPMLGAGPVPTVALEPMPATLALVPFPPPPPPVPSVPGLTPTPWAGAPAEWAPRPTTMVLTDRREPPTAVLATAWLLAVLSLGYLLPWAVAATRGRSNHGGVGLVNLLLGWTGVGWAVALVMACSAHRPVLVQVFAPSPGPLEVTAARW